MATNVFDIAANTEQNFANAGLSRLKLQQAQEAAPLVSLQNQLQMEQTQGAIQALPDLLTARRAQAQADTYKAHQQELTSRLDSGENPNSVMQNFQQRGLFSPDAKLLQAPVDPNEPGLGKAWAVSDPTFENGAPRLIDPQDIAARRQLELNIAKNKADLQLKAALKTDDPLTILNGTARMMYIANAPANDPRITPRMKEAAKSALATNKSSIPADVTTAFVATGVYNPLSGHYDATKLPDAQKYLIDKAKGIKIGKTPAITRAEEGAAYNIVGGLKYQGYKLADNLPDTDMAALSSFLVSEAKKAVVAAGPEGARSLQDEVRHQASIWVPKLLKKQGGLAGLNPWGKEFELDMGSIDAASATSGQTGTETSMSQPAASGQISNKDIQAMSLNDLKKLDKTKLTKDQYEAARNRWNQLNEVGNGQ